MSDNKRIDQEDIPDLIEQLLPIYQVGIDQLQEKAATKQLSQKDIELSIKLSACLTSTYAIYRVMRAETRREMMSLGTSSLTAFTVTPTVLLLPEPEKE